MKQDQELLISYLKKAPPALWVGWCSELSDGKAKRELCDILFDADDKLRDLTKHSVRQNVIQCVLSNSQLAKMVWVEIDSIVAQVRAKVDRSLKAKPLKPRM